LDLVSASSLYRHKFNIIDAAEESICRVCLSTLLQVCVAAAFSAWLLYSMTGKEQSSSFLLNPVGLIGQSKLNLLELGLEIFGHRFRGVRSWDS
jgi:hypothetical protein